MYSSRYHKTPRRAFPAGALLLLALLVLAASGAASGAHAQQQEQGYTISGIVVAAGKGAPLSGVVITASSGARTQSNESGRFSLEVSQQRRMVLTFRLAGFRTVTQEVDSATAALLIQMVRQ